METLILDLEKIKAVMKAMGFYVHEASQEEIQIWEDDDYVATSKAANAEHQFHDLLPILKDARKHIEENAEWRGKTRAQEKLRLALGITNSQQ